MARPRKTAEDLVPDEQPLEQLAEADEDAKGDEAGEQPTPDAPVAEEAAPAEPVAEEPPVEVDESPAPEADETEAVAEAAPAEEVPVEDARSAEVAAEEAPADEAPAPPKEKRRATKTKAEKRAARAAKPKRPARPAGDRQPLVRLPKPDRARGQRKERRGVVVSSAMDKTIVVRVDTVRPDPRYKKVVRRSTKFHAHDERNEANIGDIVRIVETRPLSKTKNWRLAEVIEAAR